MGDKGTHKCQLAGHVWTPQKYRFFLQEKEFSEITALLFHTASLQLVINYASLSYHWNGERPQLPSSQKWEAEMEPLMHMNEEGEAESEKGFSGLTCISSFFTHTLPHSTNIY